jgi:hypothetical protein
MLFGRRKHAAPAPAAVPAIPRADLPPSAPSLTDELIFAAVQRSLDGVFGAGGDWTVARRAVDQDDSIFHDVLIHSLATSVTAAVSAARNTAAPDRDAAVEQPTAVGPLGLWRAPRAEVPTVDSDLVEAEQRVDAPALSWEPAPITRWADLKRPVTGPVAVVDTAAEGDKAA